MPGLNRLHPLSYGFVGKLAQFLADRLGHPSPDFLFATRNPDSQCVTHVTYVTQGPD